MAHWISSKLKAAENLLQQIDQQAAESLGKNEKPVSDVRFGLEESPRGTGPKPLIKEQFKKKPPSYASQTSQVLARSNSDVKGVDSEPQVSRKANPRANSVGELTENDWTELLSSPNRTGVSNGRGPNQSRVSGTRTSRNDGKVGNYSRVFNKKTEKDKHEGDKGSTKSVIGLEINGDGADMKLNDVEDALPRASGFVVLESESGNGSPSLTSAGESDNATDIGVNRNASDELCDTNQNMNTLKHYSGMTLVSTNSFSTDTISASPMDGESNSATDSSSSSDSEVERERKEGRKKRQQILATRAITKAVETIKARENLLARLEGEKLSLEKILEEQTKLQVKEASDLQIVMMENMEAVEREQKKHNDTRMETFARLAKLEAVNADLSRSLATVQKNLEIEVDYIAELRQQIYRKEVACEEMRWKILHSNQNTGKVNPSKGVEFEIEMLAAECSFLADKVGRLQEQEKILETSIQTIQHEIEVPTDMEIELKGRLSQLTDFLIKKQAQVEKLVSEKAMLLLKNEAISKLLHGNSPTVDSVSLASASSRNDLNFGVSHAISNPNLKERIRRSKQHLGSLVRHLDSIFCSIAVAAKRNWRFKIWGVVYLVFLHLWAAYIFSSQPSAIISLENTSKIRAAGT